MYLFIDPIVENLIKADRFETSKMSILHNLPMMRTLTGPVNALFGDNGKAPELVDGFVTAVILPSHLLGLLQHRTAIVAFDISC
jgi:hypothetical protein